MTATLPAIERPCVMPTRSRFAACMLRALPPMKVSSASTVPSSFPPCFACKASRSRDSMNHAVFWVTPSARASS